MEYSEQCCVQILIFVASSFEMYYREGNVVNESSKVNARAKHPGYQNFHVQRPSLPGWERRGDYRHPGITQGSQFGKVNEQLGDGSRERLNGRAGRAQRDPAED